MLGLVIYHLFNKYLLDICFGSDIVLFTGEGRGQQES